MIQESSHNDVGAFGRHGVFDLRPCVGADHLPPQNTIWPPSTTISVPTTYVSTICRDAGDFATTSHISTSATGQQNHGPCQLARSSHPTHWISACPNGPSHRNPVSLIQDCVHISRGNRVYPDPIPCPLRGQAVLHHKQCALAQVICHLRLWEVDSVSRDRGNKHDTTTAFLLDHLLGSGLST